MKKILLGFFFVLCAFAVTAQSAEKIEALLNEPALSWGQVSYLVAPCYGVESEDMAKTFTLLQENGFATETGITADSKLSMADFSLVIAKTFGINKSLWYNISEAPRYAFKMLKSINLVDDKQSSEKSVSGRTAIMLIQRASELAGDL